MAKKYQSSGELLTDRVSAEMRQSKEMLDDDMFLDGKGFIGEISVSKGSKFYQDQLDKTEQGFISQNVLREICDRKSGGVLGREPRWGLVPESHKKPTAAQETLIKEAAAALVKWWNDNEMLDLMKDSLDIAFPERRAEIRPFVPSGYYDENGNLPETNTLEEALEMLKFGVHSSDTAGVFRQAETYRQYSIFKAKRGDETYIDISFVDGDGLTHFRSLKQEIADKFLENNLSGAQRAKYEEVGAVEYLKSNFSSIAAYLNESDGDGGTDTAPDPIDLNGKLFLYELDLKKPFISKSIKSLQKEINLAFTMKGRNINLAGSRERYFFNVSPSYKKKRVADDTQPSGYREEKEVVPMATGSGVATFLNGSKVFDKENKLVGVANPNVSITDPVSVQNFLDTIYAAYAAILAQAQQLHILMNDSANASGRSRREARAEFEKSLKILKARIDALGRWIIEFALSFAAAMCGRETEFAEFRCDFDSIVDAGMPDAEERKANIEDYKNNLISLETLRSRNGVEDPDAEFSVIQSEPFYEVNLLDKILDVLQKASGVLPIKMRTEILVKALGRPESEVKDILDQLAKEDPIVAATLESEKVPEPSQGGER